MIHDIGSRVIQVAEKIKLEGYQEILASDFAPDLEKIKCIRTILSMIEHMGESEWRKILASRCSPSLSPPNSPIGISLEPGRTYFSSDASVMGIKSRNCGVTSAKAIPASAAVVRIISFLEWVRLNSLFLLDALVRIVGSISIICVARMLRCRHT